LVARRLHQGTYEATLDSGLRILIEEVPQSRSVSVGVWVPVGSRDDPAAAPGLAHFIEHLAFKGTTTRAAAEISREIDAVGGSLNAATGRESTVYYVDTPSDGLTTALDLLADLTLHPAFSPENVELERAVVLDEIRGHNDDPEAFAFDRFIEGVWGSEHALSRTVLGTSTAIERIRREDVVAHHRQSYRPSQMVLAVAGAVDVERLLDAVGSRFDSDFQGAGRGGSRTPPRFLEGRESLERDGGQVHLHLALAGQPTTDPDRYALEVTNTVFGDGTSSRLFRAVREDRGLAYSVGSTLMRYTDTGLWVAYASTSPTQGGTVRALIEDEFVRLAERGLDDGELRLAKSRLRGLFILGMESNAHRAMRLGTAAITGREILSPEEVLHRLETVSADDVADTIERFVRPEALRVSLVGPAT